jgi:hypothetical protein
LKNKKNINTFEPSEKSTTNVITNNIKKEWRKTLEGTEKIKNKERKISFVPNNNNICKTLF